MRDTVDKALVVAAVLCLVCAPWSWADDGVTPSWIVFPVFLLIGLWRLSRGKGRLWLAITATVFVLVHLPWTWAGLTGGDNPANADREVNSVQWFVTLFLVPLVTAVLGWVAWRRQREQASEVAA